MRLSMCGLRDFPAPFAAGAARLAAAVYRIYAEPETVGAQQLYVRAGSGDQTLMGILMTNVVFSFGHNLLNYHSPRITYLVNASLFIYLVHHPLTLIYGAS